VPLSGTQWKSSWVWLPCSKEKFGSRRRPCVPDHLSPYNTCLPCACVDARFHFIQRSLGSGLFLPRGYDRLMYSFHEHVHSPSLGTTQVESSIMKVPFRKQVPRRSYFSFPQRWSLSADTIHLQECFGKNLAYSIYCPLMSLLALDSCVQQCVYRTSWDSSSLI
jgi:hypothetical protein